MKSTLTCMLLAVAAAGLTTMAQAGLPVYSQTFEDSATFATDATINNKDNVGTQKWIVTGADAKVRQGAGAASSARFVELEAGATLDRSFSDIAALNSATLPDKVWVEGYFKGTGSPTTLQNATYPSTAASAIVHFSSTANGIEFLNGDKAGGAGTPVSTNEAIVATNWYKITIQLDFATSSWNVWVNNVSKGTNLGFKSAGVTKLNGFKNLAQNTAFFDSFRIVLPQANDANGDSKFDAADVAAVIVMAAQATSNPAYDVIARANGDVAGPFGTLNAADASALADRLTPSPAP